MGETGREEERKKTIIIWGLDSKLNLEAAIQEVVVRTTVSGVEVEKWKKLLTREGKMLVFVQLKEEKMATELLAQKFRLRGSNISISPDRSVEREGNGEKVGQVCFRIEGGASSTKFCPTCT